MKARSIVLAVAIFTAASLNLPAQAGPNDFFGSQIGGSPELTEGPQSAASGAKGVAAAAGAPPGPPPGDYSADEKRVQKKYKDNLKRAMALVKRGEKMMTEPEDRAQKKGRVLKEIGEKAIADLKSNNPFPEVAGLEQKTK